MTKNLVVAVLVLAAVFVLTCQSRTSNNNTEEITQCPYFDRSGFVEWHDLHRWCPPFLARAMKQICRGQYNNPPDVSADNEDQARRKRSIVDECCLHCCSARSLKHSYCNDSRVDNRKLYIPPIQNEGTEIYEFY